MDFEKIVEDLRKMTLALDDIDGLEDISLRLKEIANEIEQELK